MPFIRYLDKDIQYDVKRGKRKKTVAIHVDFDMVTIRVPQRLNEERIRQFMEKKARWICDRQSLIREDKLSHIGKNYVSGESFPYLGRRYRLMVNKTTDEEATICKLRGGRLQVNIPSDLRGEEAKTAVKNSLIDPLKASILFDAVTMRLGTFTTSLVFLILNFFVR